VWVDGPLCSLKYIFAIKPCIKRPCIKAPFPKVDAITRYHVYIW
jgi:hypothetical protein